MSDLLFRRIALELFDAAYFLYDDFCGEDIQNFLECCTLIGIRIINRIRGKKQKKTQIFLGVIKNKNDKQKITKLNNTGKINEKYASPD